MKVAGVCALLLAAIALVASDDGIISVSHEGTFDCEIEWFRTQGSAVGKPGDWGSTKTLIGTKPVPQGKTETVTLPEGEKEVDFNVIMKKTPSERVQLFGTYNRKLSKMCFKTWGTVEDAHVGQTDCTSARALVASDGGAVSVTNNGTDAALLKLQYKLRSDATNKPQYEAEPVAPGETKTFTLPKDAHAIWVNVTAKDAEINPARFSDPFKMCIKTWGTTDGLDSTQVDC